MYGTDFGCWRSGQLVLGEQRYFHKNQYSQRPAHEDSGGGHLCDATTEAATENSYFTQAKLDRQSSRDAALEKLQKIVDTADKSAAAHKEAAQKIAKISDGINAENKIETLVTAKGVGQCLAIVSTDGKKVDVIVDSKDLSDTLILQIKEIAVEQVGCDYKNVTIIQSK